MIDIHAMFVLRKVGMGLVSNPSTNDLLLVRTVPRTLKDNYLSGSFQIQPLRADSTKILIELDGPRHFRQVSNWLSFEEQHSRDVYKNNMAVANGYPIIRISQEIVFGDKLDWRTLLITAIEWVNRPTELCGENITEVVYDLSLEWN